MNFGNLSQTATKSRVLLIGSALSFSDALIRIANAEFSGTKFERHVSLDLLDRLPVMPDNDLLAVIVDETQCDVLRHNIETLHRSLPNTVFVLAYRHPDIAQKLLQDQQENTALGNIRFLPMNLQFDHWLSFVRLTLCGEGMVPSELLAESPTAVASQDHVTVTETQPVEGPLGSALTKREKQVLAYVSEGKQNKIIAADMELSEHTVKLHIHHVIAKLGVRNRTEAAIWYLSQAGQDPEHIR